MDRRNGTSTLTARAPARQAVSLTIHDPMGLADPDKVVLPFPERDVEVSAWDSRQWAKLPEAERAGAFPVGSCWVRVTLLASRSRN